MVWKKGSVIMEAKPYAHVICQKFIGNHCNFCMKGSEHLKKCGGCKSIRYCGLTCQKGDWKIHKTECEIMKRVPNLPTDSIRLYLRLIICHLVRPTFSFYSEIL
ncbi:histone-lysine N-methyltransferase smyd3 [Plakobranchus ocellatus]|uniref:Histone-lysine N-methyltransferase smyd3 n=1 Tax=Plakobranchus ocellatus TaxID=259542 RepID=A0AAV3ZZP8_9GAST|nr:histone-lysine N-methyltransferase smyd3 [Plakobranchus ocellatus]